MTIFSSIHRVRGNRIKQMLTCAMISAFTCCWQNRREVNKQNKWLIMMLTIVLVFMCACEFACELNSAFCQSSISLGFVLSVFCCWVSSSLLFVSNSRNLQFSREKRFYRFCRGQLRRRQQQLCLTQMGFHDAGEKEDGFASQQWAAHTQVIDSWPWALWSNNFHSLLPPLVT